MANYTIKKGKGKAKKQHYVSKQANNHETLNDSQGLDSKDNAHNNIQADIKAMLEMCQIPGYTVNQFAEGVSITHPDGKEVTIPIVYL